MPRAYMDKIFSWALESPYGALAIHSPWKASSRARAARMSSCDAGGNIFLFEYRLRGRLHRMSAWRSQRSSIFAFEPLSTSVFFNRSNDSTPLKAFDGPQLTSN